MGMYVKISGEGLGDLKDAINFLKNNRVLVGIPGASGGSHDEITNVELAFIHTNGSPRLRIPARPFLEPGIEEGMEKIQDRMKAAAQAAIDGDTGAAMGELNKAGMYGQQYVQDYFTGGHFAPNAGITVEGGWMRNRISGKPFKVKGKGSATPLIDSGDLRGSITYVIEGK